jgi:hypothetical protein
MRKENKFEKLELALKGSPETAIYNEEILSCIKEINELTQFRYCVSVLDGKADQDEYRRKLLDAYKLTKSLTHTIEFRNIDLTNERRIIMMGQILALVSDGLHHPNPLMLEDNLKIPIIEVQNMSTEQILGDTFLYYMDWTMRIKGAIIIQIRAEAMLYSIELGKIITPELDQEGINQAWENSTKPAIERQEDGQNDQLSHKQQILLLKAIGFYDMERVKNLTTVNKGILTSYILRRDRKNSSDYIRYSEGKNNDGKFNLTTQENIAAVNKILKEVGLNDAEIKPK